MKPFSRDAGIPVLTEIIAPPAEQSIADAAAIPPIVAPIEEHNVEALEAEMLSQWSDEEWNRLERKIRERILRQILGRIDSVLEQQVRDHLADVLQAAVEGLATDIKSGLQQSLEQVVARAVAQEIIRLQTTKK
jgi:catalase